MQKQRRKQMNGSVSMYAGQQQTQTVPVRALPVAGHTTPAAYRPDTSQADDTTPRAMTLTMSDLSALPAIFSNRENSGYLAAISTVSSEEELRRLCEERTNLESLRRQSWNIYTDTTKNEQCNTVRSRRYYLTTDQREKYDKLRAERWALLYEDWNNKGHLKDKYQAITFELYHMTKHHGYYRS